MKTLLEVLVKQNLTKEKDIYHHPKVNEEDIEILVKGNKIKYKNINIERDNLKVLIQMTNMFGQNGIDMCLSFIYNIIDDCDNPGFDNMKFTYEDKEKIIYIILTEEKNNAFWGYIINDKEKNDWYYDEFFGDERLYYSKDHDKFIKEISK